MQETKPLPTLGDLLGVLLENKRSDLPIHSDLGLRLIGTKIPTIAHLDRPAVLKTIAVAAFPAVRPLLISR